MKPGVDGILQARNDRLLAVVDGGNPNGFPELDHGESAVLSAAAAARGAVLLDERKARAFVSTDPHLHAASTNASGILGLILLAKRRGNVSAVRPLSDGLMRERFWIGPRLYQRMLREADES